MWLFHSDDGNSPELNGYIVLEFTVVDGVTGNPRRDAIDPVTGERYRDIIIFGVGSEADKQTLVKGAWLSRAPARRSGHEDAERVPGQVSEHVQGLVRIVTPIEQNHCTKVHRALPLPLELGAARNSEIEVQLLRHA